MSYYLIVGGEDWKQVASISGWAEFREWVETQEGDELRHLVDYGWAQDIPKLESQLKAAIRDGSPSADVADIASACLDAMSKRKPEQMSVVLTDGLTSIDDPDESGWESED